MGHYRTKMNFNWDVLEGSEIALKRLYSLYLELGDGVGNVNKQYQDKFRECLNNDLNTPKALSLLWNVMKDENVSSADKKATILDFDKVLGLDFENIKIEEIPEEIEKLIKEREGARIGKDFKKSDKIREKIKVLGYEVKDTPEGQKVSKI